MEWLKQGGIFMLPLLVCSILMLAIVGERLYEYYQTMKIPLHKHTNAHEIIKKLRYRLPSLYTIITIAPMLGLLGTITGLMKCFHLLGKTSYFYNPQQMSAGISEALITTAAGLIIAVIATVFYNYFTSALEIYITDYQISRQSEGKDE